MWQVRVCGMERAACALCVAPAQCTQVLCVSPQLHVMRRRCVFTLLAVYGCLEEQQAKGSSGSVGECKCNGCVVC